MNGLDMLVELERNDNLVSTFFRGLEIRGRVDIVAPDFRGLWIWESGTGDWILLYAAEVNIEVVATAN